MSGFVRDLELLEFEVVSGFVFVIFVILRVGRIGSFMVFLVFLLFEGLKLGEGSRMEFFFFWLKNVFRFSGMRI